MHDTRTIHPGLSLDVCRTPSIAEQGAPPLTHSVPVSGFDGLTVDCRIRHSNGHDSGRRSNNRPLSATAPLQVVQVEEPTEEEALACLLGLAPRYEAHHGVAYTPEALSAAVRCAKRYVSHRRLPDSAIDLIDMAASKAVLRHANVDVSATMSRPLEPPTRQTRNTTPAATVADTPAPAPAPPAHTQGSHKLALFQRTVLREGLYDSSQGGSVRDLAEVMGSQGVAPVLGGTGGGSSDFGISSSSSSGGGSSSGGSSSTDTSGYVGSGSTIVYEDGSAAGKSSEQQAAGGSSCKDRNVTQQADGSASCEKSSTCSNSGSCGSDSGSGSSSSGPPTIDARHTPHAAADGGRSGGAVPPDAVVSSRSLDPAVDWQEWVESQGWAGQPEEHRQKLLLWFGASPEFPIAGVAGHQQTVAERRKVHSKLFDRPNKAAPEHFPSTTRAPVQKGCPHCGTLATAQPEELLRFNNKELQR
ncbi:MAG: hypothetical protein WDW36_005196 [Sanguina aurantia]